MELSANIIDKKDKKDKKNYKLILAGILLILILTIPLTILLTKTIQKLKEKTTNKNKNNSNSDNNNNNNYNKRKKKKKVSSINIIKTPNKIQYKVGEVFDKRGMIIQAIYTDNTESNVENYFIDKILPLTIYDTKIKITYKEHSTLLNIKITNDFDVETHPNLSKESYTLEFQKGFTRFEIENADLTNWFISGGQKNKVIERYDASGGKYLSGLDVLTDGHLIINIKLEDSYDIIIMVSYSQKEEWKYYDVDISTIYNLVIDEKYVLEIDGDNMLKSREDTTQWQIIKYKSLNLNKGMHILSIYVQGNKEIGAPNIDYIDFFNYKSEVVPVYLDSDGKPSNDFHTSLQYRYLTDENVENIFSYASGSKDLSRPQGNILNFTDSITETSNSYIIQISSSLYFNTPDTKIIKDLKEKNYTIKNLKLGQKIFYRGSINEPDLIKSKIYIYTVNNIIGLRNVEIPGVDNSRDIGGYKTSLVENGTIKQGLYYRTAQLDDITTEGKKILRDNLGVKVEIDLRDSRYNKGPYVDGIEYHPIPIPHYSKRKARFDEFHKEYYNVFDLISEADKKPIALHCEHGASRTGIMSFALLALLGCEYNDIARDYLFTNFANQNQKDINTDFKGWWDKLNNIEGDSTAEKAKKWLLTKGIEEEKLERIREIFIEGYKESKQLNKNNNILYKNNEFEEDTPEFQVLEILDEKANNNIHFFK